MRTYGDMYGRDRDAVSVYLIRQLCGPDDLLLLECRSSAAFQPPSSYNQSCGISYQTVSIGGRGRSQMLTVVIFTEIFNPLRP